MTHASIAVPSHSWTLRQKLGQLIVVRAGGFLFDSQIRYPAWEPRNDRLREWLETLNLGGVILLGGSAAEVAIRTAQLQRWSPVPLLMAADIEEGVGQRFTGATWFPPPMTLGAIAEENLELAEDYAYAMGNMTAQEALAIGLNWVLAPIVDVNNNPQNPVINVRAFGENPAIVQRLIKQFIAGAQKLPVLTTAKHFPGHGDTDCDSHLQLPVVPHTVDRLSAVELPPFKTAIAQGVDSVMTAHLQVPAWDKVYPATLSPEILTGQLRQTLGFDGLIVTDALIMGGITQFANPEDVAVQAIAAGADILLMPPDPVVAINALEKAVQDGRLTETRIDESLARIHRAKAKLQPAPPPDQLPTRLQTPDALGLAQAMVQTALRQGGSLPVAPLEKGNPGENWIVVDDWLMADFLDRACPALTVPTSAGYRPRLLTADILPQIPDPDQPFILQIFVRGNPFRGQAGLTETTQAQYRHLLTLPSLQGLILYGSPYVLETFQSYLAPTLPRIFSHAQMPQAQAIATRTLLGVSLPNYFDPVFT